VLLQLLLASAASLPIHHKSEKFMSHLPRVESPENLEGYLANVIDVWHKAHPDLTVQEILNALETIRHKLTEGMIRSSHFR